MSLQTNLDTWKTLLETVRDDSASTMQQKVEALRHMNRTAKALYELLQGREQFEASFSVAVPNATIRTKLNEIINQSNVIEPGA